jgi:hypothetical protein
MLGLVVGGCGASGFAPVASSKSASTAHRSSSVAAAPLPLPTLTASRSNDLYGSCGVNTHLQEYVQSQYGNQALIASLLGSLNCPNVRESFTDFSNSNESFTIPEMQSLVANQHVRFNYVSDTSETIATLRSAQKTMGSAMKSGEGLNEADNSGSSDWQIEDPLAQETLYTALHGDGVSIYSPTIVNASDSTMMGDLRPFLNYCAIHDYAGGRNPGTAGFGAYDSSLGETYGSEAYTEAYSKNFCGTPTTFVSTETGYADNGSADGNTLPSDVKAAYTLRTLLFHWLTGVVSTYFYELKDDNSPGFTSFGLADSSGNPKPAFIALENFQALTADPTGTTFSTTSLPIAITGGSSDVQHVLVQRADGSYLLWLWRENEDYNVNTGAYETANQSTETVTLSLATKPSAAETFQFNGDGSVTTATLTPSTALSVPVSWLPIAVRVGTSTDNPSFVPR